MLNTKALAATAAAAAPKVYIEDVFSTWLYTGNGSTQTITNGIDLSGKGGMVWIKGRSAAYSPYLYDTSRGALKALRSDATDASFTWSDTLTSFSSSGFSLGADASSAVNTNAATYASWTFRKAAKFFDVVTYTGNGTTQAISHNLGSTPGAIIVKRANGASFWRVYHRSFPTGYGTLDFSDQFYTGSTVFGNNSSVVAPTSTQFTTGNDLNDNGGTYVAYLFAHDAGGFGDSGADNVISCGSYTGNGSTSGPTVTLGWEPQWVLIKASSAAGSWFMLDTMRGIATGGDDAYLSANTANAEALIDALSVTPTGFQLTTTSGSFNTNTATYIYIAIRRGPMKTPTDATKVFTTSTYSGNGLAGRKITGIGFPPDFMIGATRNLGIPQYLYDKLRGKNRYLTSAYTAVEGTISIDSDGEMLQDGFAVSGTAGSLNSNSRTYANWLFRRAPGFFDVVAYRSPGGTPDPQVVNHNLQVSPELIIVKNRSDYYSWVVWQSSLGTSNLNLDTNSAAGVLTARVTGATSTTFSVGAQGQAGGILNNDYIAYLFATLTGISKVGSYTGTGTTKDIDCGFTAGARFVLIKRTDSTGDWYVWDTARGIISGSDPYSILNSTPSAEVTNTDYIDPLNSGFQISSTAPAAINANGGSFIFLAIA